MKLLNKPRPDFNPRSRMGSDRSTRFRCSLRAYFNPRSRMGSDVLTKELVECR